MQRIIPAEWAPQARIWTAWPSHGDLWLENLEPARAEVAAMVLALASAGAVHVLAMGTEAQESAAHALTHKNVKIIPAQFGDIWLRDTGPIFAAENGKKIALTFRFNGWGGKYELEHDDEVGAFVAQQSGAEIHAHDFVLEGGALEHDGAGGILTTRECLLNPNRGANLTQELVEKRLKQAFGAKKIYWLDRGLVNDHTDGHVDNLARFIAPGRVLCQSPSGPNDPNAEIFAEVVASLKTQGLEAVQISSPGLVANEDGEPVAASHMNYILFNGVLVLPVYDKVHGEQAAAALAKIFPQHRIVSVPARHVLTGGGSFHCITQQECS